MGNKPPRLPPLLPGPAEGRYEVPLLPGTLVGEYRLERALAKTQSSAFFAASDPNGREVTIKVFLGWEEEDETATEERFVREVRALEAVRHLHVPHLIEAGHLRGATPYLVTEALEGRDLAQVIRQGPLRLALAARYVRDAALGVHAAHRAGVVHRGLKASSLLLANQSNAEPVLKVLDFGAIPVVSLAKASDDEGMTEADQHMAPEQIVAGGRADQRTDVWALGVVLFRLLTDAWPFRGETLEELQENIVEGSATRVHERRPDVDAGLERVMQMCFAKAPYDRFATALDLAEALEPYTVAQTSSARMAAAKARAASLVTPAPAPRVPHAPSSPSRARQVPSVGDAEDDAEPTPTVTDAKHQPVLQRRKRLWLAATAALSVFAATVVAVRSFSTTASSVKGGEPTAHVTASAGQDSVALTLNVEPQDAEIRIDDEPVATRIVQLRRDTLHTVVIRRAGYEPVTRQLHLKGDTVLEIVLPRANPPKPSLPR